MKTLYEKEKALEVSINLKPTPVLMESVILVYYQFYVRSENG